MKQRLERIIGQVAAEEGLKKSGALSSGWTDADIWVGVNGAIGEKAGFTLRIGVWWWPRRAKVKDEPVILYSHLVGADKLLVDDKAIFYGRAAYEAMIPEKEPDLDANFAALIHASLSRLK